MAIDFTKLGLSEAEVRFFTALAAGKVDGDVILESVAVEAAKASKTASRGPYGHTSKNR